MKLYKFRPLVTCHDFDRIISIIEDGFYCCSFLDFNDVNEGVFAVSQNASNVTLDQKQIYRICSFSNELALERELMWGHYASGGMGVAIEIEVNDSSGIFKKVEYGVSGRYSDVLEILTNKSKEWCYEKELRYISTNQEKFYKHRIKKIYFGTPYKNLVNFQEIKNKHRKLREYLRLSDLLKNECTWRRIESKDYCFS